MIKRFFVLSGLALTVLVSGEELFAAKADFWGKRVARIEIEADGEFPESEVRASIGFGPADLLDSNAVSEAV